jgi:hypothetical protein
LNRALLAALLSLAPTAAVQVPEAEPGIVRVSVKGLEITGASIDRVSLSVRSELTATRNLRLKRIRFERMRIGDVPVYLEPVEQRVDLAEGAPTALPPIDVTVYFRDIASLEPLRKAVQAGQVTMTGSVRADLELSFLERLSMGDMSPAADVPLTTTVPLTVPGGVPGQSASLAALDLAAAAMALADTPLASLGRRAAQDGSDAAAAYLPGLLVAESRYALEQADGQRRDVQVAGLGFRISADEFVVPGELSEPWAYDIGVVTALQAQGAKLIREATDLRVWPAGEPRTPASARTLASGAIRQVRKPGGPEVTLVQVGGRLRRIRLARRDAEGNRAVYRLVAPGDRAAGLPLARLAPGDEQTWERLLVFRVGLDGTVAPVAMPARREKARIVLRDPIDDRAFGSPLIAPDGVVGVLQDERGGVVLDAQ